MLAVADDQAFADWRQAAALGSLATSASQARTGAAMREPAFLRWFGTAQSQMLAINGMEPMTGGISATTHLVALVRETLQDSPNAIPITFFCEAHASPEDSISGVGGVMRALCLQLLPVLPAGHTITCEDDGRWMNGLQRQNLACLSELFKRLLFAVAAVCPGRVVFCMIDDVTWMVDQDVTGLQYVMNQFRAFTNELRSAGEPIVLKVLLTSGMYCMDFDNVLRDDEVVTLKLDFYEKGSRLGLQGFDFELANDPYDVF